MLQCGRTFSSAEVNEGAVRSRGGFPASMWPHFFKCGSSTPCGAATRMSDASMWPHFFKCGSQDKHFHLAPREEASMWPHFFKCGSFGCRCFRALPHLKLQCGRTFSSAEVPEVTSTEWGNISSFNVAALFQVRKYPRQPPHRLPNRRLQCGRTFSSAEVLGTWRIGVATNDASMWPHFFKCGSGYC